MNEKAKFQQRIKQMREQLNVLEREGLALAQLADGLAGQNAVLRKALNDCKDQDRSEEERYGGSK